MRLSEHFDRREFACRCGCGFDTVDVALLELLERVRGHFGQPVRVLSGCRCEAHNRAIGGARHSRHLWGQAADIDVLGVHPDDVADWLEGEMAGYGGLGRYDSWTHMDVRSTLARWDERT